MHPLAPLIGVLILSGVLTVNYFRTAWRLGILRAFGRRARLNWRVIIAGCVAACLPVAGALIALTLMPTDVAGNIQASPLKLAAEMAFCGWVMHLLNDAIVQWGMPGRTA